MKKIVKASLIFGIIIAAGAMALAQAQVGAGAGANKAIGLDKGVNAALQDAGFKSDEVTGLIAQYDNEDGTATYEVEFTAGGFEYEYTIKAADGTVLEARREEAEAPKIKESDVKFEDKLPDTEAPSQAQEPEPKQAKEPATAEAPVQASEPSQPASKYIGVDKAKSIALSDAGLKSSEATFTKAKLDKEDGVTVYEIEIYSGRAEYEYEIDASTGAIRDKDIDRDDDDDDDDDDDEWDD